MNTPDPGPAPWDLPTVAAGPDRPKRRGSAGVKREAQLRAIRAKIIKPADTVGLSDCPVCQTLVLTGDAEGRPVTVDVWQVPYADACVLSRYLGYRAGLWMAGGGEHAFSQNNQLFLWDEFSKSSALLNHYCTSNGPDRWWNRGPFLGFSNDYAKDDVYL